MKSKDQNLGRRVQLHRAISKLGWASRTQAWEWIVAGEVLVDGQIVRDPLTWVHVERQRITRQGNVTVEKETIVLALNKPRDMVVTRKDERGRPTVYDVLPAGLPWLHPVGRLDADSEGLLLFTNDSSLSARLTDPDCHVPKVYRVSLTGELSEESIQQLREGIDLPDGRTRPTKVRILQQGEKQTEMEIVLTEGRNRQIRRMAWAVGHRVRRLIRVAIGGLELGVLAPGQSRILGPQERETLLRNEK